MNTLNAPFPAVTTQPAAHRASDSACKCPDGVVSKWVIPFGGALSALCGYCVVGFAGVYVGGPVGATVGIGIGCAYAACNHFEGTNIRERETANFTRMDTLPDELPMSCNSLRGYY
ncbi:hypothetical protein [Endozoicomonas sp. ONNA2]|uniref:hypothetical protein n=1 Tax=Endozoicomonas sp. ONNA2 TaxID=2828741 RepID=UPI0021477714|nr:hypothetical protein [Endozoicomonas sp. ONNA2]